ncbi:MAG: hypothetical protein H6619_01640 [Deltaproteobacteria bacterium]|nr:hypothetical protein [Deltaproteobacteria bacterium]
MGAYLLDLALEQEIIDKLAAGSKSERLTPDEIESLADITFAFTVTAVEDQPNQPVTSYLAARGSNGCTHLVVDLPIQDQLVDATLGRVNPKGTVYNFETIRDLANEDVFRDRCFGLIIRSKPTVDSAMLALSPGQIWSLREFGQLNPTFDLDLSKASSEKVECSMQDREGTSRIYLVGRPSDEVLPPNLRPDLAAQIKAFFEIETVKACVLQDARSGSKALLTYNVFFKDPAEIQRSAAFLRALHPPNYRLALLDEADRALEQYMFKL